jgi:hypothetical protein
VDKVSERISILVLIAANEELERRRLCAAHANRMLKKAFCEAIEAIKNVDERIIHLQHLRETPKAGEKSPHDTLLRAKLTQKLSTSINRLDAIAKVDELVSEKSIDLNFNEIDFT